MRLTYQETDNGNCRVYYKEGRKLRCFQEDRRDKFTLYICSSDGEPEYEAKPASLQIDSLPIDDCSVAKSFIAWFAKYHEWQTWEG